MWWPDRVHITYRTAARMSIEAARARSVTYGCLHKCGLRHATNARVSSTYLGTLREGSAHSDELEREHGFRWCSGHRNRWTRRVIRSQPVGAIVACVYRMGSLQDDQVHAW